MWTEDDLVAALDALLESGLLLVEIDDLDEDAVPRFRPTKRGEFAAAFGVADVVEDVEVQHP